MRETLARGVINRLDSPLAVLDDGGTVVYTNDTWEGLDTPETVPGAVTVGEPCLPACEAIADEAVAERARESLETVLAGNTDSVRVSYTAPWPATLGRRFRLQARRFDSENGEHVLVEHREVTEEYRVSRERDHYEQTLADVASVVSHDIRSPITAALSWAELLDADPDTDSEQVGRVTSALERMNAMADTTVTLARETGVDDVAPVELGRVAETVWTDIDTAGELVVEESDRVLADERALEVLLEHLFRNATQHGTRVDGGTDAGDLTVRVGLLASGFYIEDSGAGIEDNLRDNLFDPGVTTGSAQENTGIGLTIVERAAGAHGWEVTAGEGGDGGARFEITGVTPG
ncbi:MAG: signal transduction histidine kinase [halophilic archaeon J07HX64]|jgi:Signal transduction histidine kinase|nr:MAG: signal transduction histidine kinase [halophilic archaeon J07HX64]